MIEISKSILMGLKIAFVFIISNLNSKPSESKYQNNNYKGLNE